MSEETKPKSVVDIRYQFDYPADYQLLGYSSHAGRYICMEAYAALQAELETLNLQYDASNAECRDTSEELFHVKKERDQLQADNILKDRRIQKQIEHIEKLHNQLADYKQEVFDDSQRLVILCRERDAERAKCQDYERALEHYKPYCVIIKEECAYSSQLDEFKEVWLAREVLAKHGGKKDE